ncbi:uncharacterized protein Dana_GF28117 [Drosophila ananassae]|uniref:Uncharacterized protein n=1 Tax=Drosophila ananassae TaxID=7217 RepID=A0A0P9AM41_DROAN|nr:uncharacterized protein Dana_GF28117 [Drosophila ananassae]
MRLLLFSIFFIFVNGLKNFDPNLLVNTTDSDAAWISVPEDHVKSVFFTIKRSDKCPSYDYKV